MTKTPPRRAAFRRPDPDEQPDALVVDLASRGDDSSDALACGASAYVEKGEAFSIIVSTLIEVTEGARLAG